MNDKIYENVTTLTFDCYGTLIDWRAGRRACFLELFGPGVEDRLDELAAVYEETEAEVQSGPYRSYREVLGEVSRRLADRVGVELSPDQASRLATSLPSWPPFPDTRSALDRLKRRFRLGILSNVDRDLFADTSRCLGLSFDFIVTAQDVESYKPARAHFEALFANHARPEEVLHVAQSLFHDGLPAQEVDLAYVWINRYNDVDHSDAQPLAVYPDLQSLADALCDTDSGTDAD